MILATARNIPVYHLIQLNNQLIAMLQKIEAFGLVAILIQNHCWIYSIDVLYIQKSKKRRQTIHRPGRIPDAHTGSISALDVEGV